MNAEEKRAYEKEWCQKNPEKSAARFKKHYESRKQSLVYVIIINNKYYFGQTTIGLYKRKLVHLSQLKLGKGNPHMQKMYDALGEEEFRKQFRMESLGLYESKEQVRQIEKYLIKLYKDRDACMNVKS